MSKQLIVEACSKKLGSIRALWPAHMSEEHAVSS